MGSWFYILVFFTGVVQPTQSSHREFFLIQQSTNWTEALSHCRSNYTDLAVVRSDADLVQLRSEAQKHQFASDAWVGLYLDIESWRWSLDNTPLGPVRKWAKINLLNPEPNNNGGHQMCTAINANGWWDLNCGLQLPFVCFDDKQSGNGMYVYYPVLKSWSGAQAYCRQYHTDLASSRNNSEDAVIMGLVSSTTWIGLFRDGWKWLDHSVTFNMTWMSGKPDNAQGRENCAYVVTDQVADALCSDMKAFFCYTVTTRWTVRLQIDTSQDVHGQAVKESVLEMLRQKLKDRGLVQNLVLKWREQAPGVEFLKIEANNTADVKEKTCNVDF